MSGHSHTHHDGADHDHDDHGHAHAAGGHGHAPGSFGTAFAIGIALNGAFVATQVFYGLAAHSVALLADAVHNLGDVLGLIMAWTAMRLAKRGPTPTRTYGWGRGTILASLSNAVVLLLGCGGIAIEAVQRIAHPQPIAAGIVMWVAAAGIAINGTTALMFMRGRKHDLNIKGAFLHMAADAAVSAGVVLAALAIQFSGLLWLDPITSLLIVAVIILGTWSLLRDSVNLAMDAVPGGIQLAKVEAALLALPGVCEVHDLHIWALSTTETALTAHLIQTCAIEPRVIESGVIDSGAMESGANHQGAGSSVSLIAQASAEVRTRFNIGHSTFQVETAESADACALRPAGVV